jgi:hypothetical protein
MIAARRAARIASPVSLTSVSTDVAEVIMSCCAANPWLSMRFSTSIRRTIPTRRTTRHSASSPAKPNTA